jgi:hypothetical protein
VCIAGGRNAVNVAQIQKQKFQQKYLSVFTAVVLGNIDTIF